MNLYLLIVAIVLSVVMLALFVANFVKYHDKPPGKLTPLMQVTSVIIPLDGFAWSLLWLDYEPDNVLYSAYAILWFMVLLTTIVMVLVFTGRPADSQSDQPRL